MSDFLMPSLGADMEAGVLMEWLVKPGDRVERGQIVAVVETQKGAIEIEIFEDGQIQSLEIVPGTEVPVGTVLARLSASDAPVLRSEAVAESAPTLPEAPASAVSDTVSIRAAELEVPAAALAQHSASAERLRISPLARQRARELGLSEAVLAQLTGTGPQGALCLRDIEKAAQTPPGVSPLAPHASPSARQKALELGVDLQKVQGSGPHGLTTAEDVERVVSQHALEKPVQNPMRAAIAAAMSRSKREIPHYYLAHSFDFEPALSWLEALNETLPMEERLVYAVLLVKAVALALKKFPEMNGFWQEGAFVPLEQIDIGLAISLRTGGLVAPALKQTDQKNLKTLMAEFRDLVNRSRGGQLRASEMRGGTITVTNLGEQGVESVFPVIYPPQVAMVGFGTVLERPWVIEGQILPRRVIQVSLAGDHRVSDGHRGAMFLARIGKLLHKPEKLL